VLMVFTYAGYEEHFWCCREIAVQNDSVAGVICQRSWWSTDACTGYKWS
jgi:hypothetical protein